MAIEEMSRAEELRALGWSPEDVRRYEELWEYRHRWGAINLEREDRLFLRRAEAALPPLTTGRGAQRKSLREKSYVRWLAFHLEAIRRSGIEDTLGEGEAGAWPILLEEELRALEELQPVLGLPDTLRARAFQPERERWAAEAGALGRNLRFDFGAALQEGREKGEADRGWKPLRGEGCADPSAYAVLPGDAVEAFRTKVREQVTELLRTLPSVREREAAAGAG
ncbi:MAG: hypothetical protein VKI81_05760 [Synechococcaceae cyanobacterium]|nr:hypothetical protein [Synechococcaceae cyanobacterium]